jgi:hypothetical protein
MLTATFVQSLDSIAHERSRRRRGEAKAKLKNNGMRKLVEFCRATAVPEVVDCFRRADFMRQIHRLALSMDRMT